MATGAKRRKGTPWRLTAAEAAACRAAKGLGLYVFVEGRGRDRVWRVSSAATGRLLGLFWPSSGLYRIGDRVGRAGDWAEVLAAAMESMT